jgi:hypothetical protein
MEQAQAAQAVEPTTAPVEGVAPSAPETKAQNPDLIALARKEKMIREQQKAFQSEKQSFEQERAALKAEAEKAKAFQERLRKDPYGVFQDLGIKSDEAAALFANQPDPQAQTTQMLQSEINQLKQLIENANQSQQTAAQAQLEQAKKQIGVEIEEMVKGSENFEVLQAYGEEGRDAVVNLIERVFNEKGYVIDYKKAATEVENYYLEKALQFASLKKIQAKLTQEKPTEAAAKAPDSKQPPQTKTLTSGMTAQPKKAFLSEKERIERAKLRFTGQLT